MGNGAEDLSKKRDRGRVLFSGNGELIINNLIDHMPDRYQMLKCAPNVAELVSAVDKFHPHAIVVCLLNETREMLQAYYPLEEKQEYKNIPVIAIGHEDDCFIFQKNVLLKKVHLFTRPLDRPSFLETLEKCVTAAVAEEAAALAKTDEKLSAQKAEDEQKLKEDQERKAAQEAENLLIAKIEKDTLLHGRKVILVVDDDVRMLNIIKMYLQELYDVVVVPSGKLALKYLAKKEADLVLLDYLMPELDGPAVLQQIREESHYPNIPVVFLTGVSDKDLVMKGLEFHPNGYLLKPTSKTILLERVTEILLGI